MFLIDFFWLTHCYSEIARHPLNNRCVKQLRFMKLFIAIAVTNTIPNSCNISIFRKRKLTFSFYDGQQYDGLIQ